jgi:hypothetical protein
MDTQSIVMAALVAITVAFPTLLIGMMVYTWDRAKK